jgi:hypothetical protein
MYDVVDSSVYEYGACEHGELLATLWTYVIRANPVVLKRSTTCYQALVVSKALPSITERFCGFRERDGCLRRRFSLRASHS